ncbi:MAG: hypothetical protein KAR65_09410 [Anaerolineales bacterium]|nr:hypothetical protein [Anaerolineales bacterium]MCK5634508.1 hypothetical protein [Anaerolineales bacterium]
MPRVRCHYLDCVYLEDGFCGIASVEIDPDEGCRTYRREGESPDDDDWDDENLEEIWDEDEDGILADNEEPDDWLSEDV